MPTLHIFRKQGIFATYANVHSFEEELQDLPDAFWDFYMETFPGKIAHLAVAIEPYKERQGHHAHVLCHFNERHAYTMEAITFKSNRPNVATDSRWGRNSVSTMAKYVTKGSDADLIRSDFPTGESIDRGPAKMDVFRRSINSSTRTEAETILKEEAPDVYIKSFANVQSFLTSNFSGASNQYHTPDGYEFSVPVGVQDWVETQFDPEVSYVGAFGFSAYGRVTHPRLIPVHRGETVVSL